MVIIKLQGGLGNQMFQYAFGYALSQKSGLPLKFDISSFDRDQARDYALAPFGLNLHFASQQEINRYKFKREHILEKLLRLIRKTHKKINDSTYIREKTSPPPANTCSGYFEGYWQSEGHFSMYRADLLEQFQVDKFSESAQHYLNLTRTHNNSISLHIRRGDYANNPAVNNIHGLCGLDYYDEAVQDISKGLESPELFIFSDDTEWVQSNFRSPLPMHIIENTADRTDLEEMLIMSSCQHNIIANSSFSWWGAWLNQHAQKRVIAPKKWFVDPTRDTSELVPKAWKRI